MVLAPDLVKMSPTKSFAAALRTSVACYIQYLGCSISIDGAMRVVNGQSCARPTLEQPSSLSFYVCLSPSSRTRTNSCITSLHLRCFLLGQCHAIPHKRSLVNSMERPDQ